MLHLDNKNHKLYSDFFKARTAWYSARNKLKSAQNVKPEDVQNTVAGAEVAALSTVESGDESTPLITENEEGSLDGSLNSESLTPMEDDVFVAASLDSNSSPLTTAEKKQI